jgi:hypothetical protein
MDSSRRDGCAPRVSLADIFALVAANKAAEGRRSSERYRELRSTEFFVAEMIEIQISAAKFPRGLSPGRQVCQFHL